MVTLYIVLNEWISINYEKANVISLNRRKPPRLLHSAQATAGDRPWANASSRVTDQPIGAPWCSLTRCRRRCPSRPMTHQKTVSTNEEIALPTRIAPWLLEVKSSSTKRSRFAAGRWEAYSSHWDCGRTRLRRRYPVIWQGVLKLGTPPQKARRQ